MIGTSIADADNPLEIVRIIRSFDPCIACAVHLIKPNGEMKKFRVI
jgi:hydrogenase large subunit